MSRRIIAPALILIALIFVGAIISFSFLSGDESAPDEERALQERIERLIEQLGSEVYAERIAAREALEEIGADAIAALRQATRHDDPEIAASSKKLLEKILESTGKLKITFAFIDAEGAPLKGVNVKISGQATSPPPNPKYNPFEFAGITGEDGRVSIQQVEGYSACRFNFTVEGYTAENVAPTKFQYGKVVYYVRCVKSGEVRGVVVDADNNDAPVVNCLVTLGQTARTAEDGRFTISGVRPGLAKVSISSAPARYRILPESMFLLVRSGQTTEATIRVVKDNMRYGKAACMVMGPYGKPMSNTPVYVIISGAKTDIIFNSSWQFESMMNIFVKVTDNEGKFTIENLPIGTLRIRVKARSYAAMSDEQTVTIKGSEVVELKPFEIRDGSTLAVKVFDKDGKPAMDAGVIINRTDAPGLKLIPETALPQKGLLPNVKDAPTMSRSWDVYSTQARGMAVIWGLQPGKYNIMAVGKEQAPSEMISVEIKKGDKAREIELSLRNFGQARLELVEGETNKPLGVSEVIPINEMDFTPQIPGGIEVRPEWKYSNPPGQVLVDKLPPGRYRIALRTAGHVSAATTLDVKAGEKTEQKVVMDPVPAAPGMLAGKIIADKAAPMSDVGSIILRNIIAARNDTTFLTLGKTGRFSAECPPGAYELTVLSRTGLLLAQRHAVIGANKTTEVNISLPRMGSISGRLLDGEGKPFANRVLCISAMSGVSNPYRQDDIIAQTDKDGAFKTKSIAEGDYTIQFPTAGDSSSLYNINPCGGAWSATVKGGEETKVEIVVEKPTTVSGEVKGRWKSGVMFTLLPKGKPVEMMSYSQLLVAVSDEEGRFAIDGIAPGEYQLVAKSSLWNCGVVKEIKVEAGKPPAVLEIEMPEQLQKIRGVINGLPSLSIPYDMIIAVGRCWAMAWVRPDGSFEMHIPPGKYTLRLSSRNAPGGVGGVEITVEEGRDVEGVEIP